MSMEPGQPLGVVALAKLAGISKASASKWLAGIHTPSPLARERLQQLGVTLEAPPRVVARYMFPSRNTVTFSLVGDIANRKLAAEFRRPLSKADLRFYQRTITPAVVKRLGEVLELRPLPREDGEA